MMTRAEIIKARTQLVVKANELIQNASYNLTAREQKLILYVISLIKPDDKELQWYYISVMDFCEITGIERNKFYSEVKEIMEDIDKQSFYVIDDRQHKRYIFRWFAQQEYLENKGMFRVQLNSNLKPYLLKLKERYTMYELIYVLGLKRKYSIRLYELIKSKKYSKSYDVETFEISVEKLKEMLYIGNKYPQYRDLKRDVLDKSVEEITSTTDMKVWYDKKTKGRKVIAIIFYIQMKEPLDRYERYKEIERMLNKKSGNIEGQIEFDFI